MSHLLVGHDPLRVPDDVPENAELADDVHQLRLGAGPHHVVLRGDSHHLHCHTAGTRLSDGRVDPVHEDVGVAFLTALNIFQEGFDIFSIDIVATSLSLRL